MLEQSSVFIANELSDKNHNKKLFSMFLLFETWSFSVWEASLSHQQSCFLLFFFLSERAQTFRERVLKSICLKSLWREWNTRQNQCWSLKQSLLPSRQPNPPQLWGLISSGPRLDMKESSPGVSTASRLTSPHSLRQRRALLCTGGSVKSAHALVSEVTRRQRLHPVSYVLTCFRSSNIHVGSQNMLNWWLLCDVFY